MTKSSSSSFYSKMHLLYSSLYHAHLFKRKKQKRKLAHTSQTDTEHFIFLHPQYSFIRSWSQQWFCLFFNDIYFRKLFFVEISFLLIFLRENLIKIYIVIKKYVLKVLIDNIFNKFLQEKRNKKLKKTKIKVVSNHKRKKINRVFYKRERTFCFI